MADVIGTNPQDSHTLTLQGIDELVEQNKLLPMIRASLNMSLIHQLPYYDEQVPVGEGQVFTVTKEGIPDAEQDPTAPPSQSYGIAGIDDGLTPLQPGYEQFSIKMNPYRQTVDFRMSDSVVTNLNKYTSRVNQLAKKMARTLNIGYRRPLTVAAQFGHAYITTNDTDTAITTVDVSNVAGFNIQWVGGVPLPVSGSNKIKAVLQHSTDKHLIEVTGITIGTRDDKSDLTPGTLTYNVLNSQAGYDDGPIAAVSVGDPVVALQASVIKRPGGKSSAWSLGTSDNLTLDLIIDTAASMLGNGVDPDFRYNKILVLGGHKAWSALMKDEDFKTIYRDRYATDEFSAGNVVELMNCRMVFGHDAPDQTKADGVHVRHLLFCGNEAAARGVYAAADPRGPMGADESDYIDVGPQYNTMFDPISQVKTIQRKPINRGGDIVATTMQAILGMSAVPDTATGDWCENPLAAYKRIAAIEFRA